MSTKTKLLLLLLVCGLAYGIWACVKTWYVEKETRFNSVQSKVVKDSVAGVNSSQVLEELSKQQKNNVEDSEKKVKMKFKFADSSSQYIGGYYYTEGNVIKHKSVFPKIVVEYDTL